MSMDRRVLGQLGGCDCVNFLSQGDVHLGPDSGIDSMVRVGPLVSYSGVSSS